MECRVATTFDWEWGPSTLQSLGKAQALRVYIYIYTYNIYTHHLDDYMLSGYYYIYIPTTHS